MGDFLWPANDREIAENCRVNCCSLGQRTHIADNVLTYMRSTEENTPPSGISQRDWNNYPGIGWKIYSSPF